MAVCGRRRRGTTKAGGTREGVQRATDGRAHARGGTRHVLRWPANDHAPCAQAVVTVPRSEGVHVPATRVMATAPLMHKGSKDGEIG